MGEKADDRAGRDDVGTADGTGHAARDPTDPEPTAAALAEEEDAGEWADGDHLPFVGGAVPHGFTQRVVEIGPGARRPYDSSEWADALVVVERGDLVLECHRGGQRTFPAGSVICLAGLPLHTMRSTRDGPVVLVSVVRG